MTRLEKFESYENHAWMKKLLKKLSIADRVFALEFLKATASLNKNEFEYKLNRLFLDQPKRKNYEIILELLSCANS